MGMFTWQKMVILKKRIVEPTGNEFKPIILPESMVEHILVTALNYSGDNGFPKTYAAIRHLYYRVGMKKDVQTTLYKCVKFVTKHNIAKVKFEKNPFQRELNSPCSSSQWIWFEGFYLPSWQGHRCALTVICMHTSYMFCIQLKTKDSPRSHTGLQETCLH